MGSKAPPIPPDQRSSPDEKPHITGSGHHRDKVTGDQPDPGGVNLREQGQQGAIYQNTRNKGHQQDR